MLTVALLKITSNFCSSKDILKRFHTSFIILCFFIDYTGDGFWMWRISYYYETTKKKQFEMGLFQRIIFLLMKHNCILPNYSDALLENKPHYG